VRALATAGSSRRRRAARIGLTAPIDPWLCPRRSHARARSIGWARAAKLLLQARGRRRQAVRRPAPARVSALPPGADESALPPSPRSRMRSWSTPFRQNSGAVEFRPVEARRRLSFTAREPRAPDACAVAAALESSAPTGPLAHMPRSCPPLEASGLAVRGGSVAASSGLQVSTSRSGRNKTPGRKAPMASTSPGARRSRSSGSACEIHPGSSSPGGDPRHALRDRARRVHPHLLGMRARAAAGLWLPPPPPMRRSFFLGGMGLGHVELRHGPGRGRERYYGPWVLTTARRRRRNMHTLLHWGTDGRRKSTFARSAQGHALSCFAMTEPAGRGLRPDAIQDRAVRPATNGRQGHNWVTPMRGGRRSPSCSPHGGQPREAQAANNGIPSSTSPTQAGRGCARSRPLRWPAANSEIASEPPGARGNVSADAATDIGSASIGWGPARWPHCMRWIAPSRRPSRHDGRPLHEALRHGSRLSEKQGNQVADAPTPRGSSTGEANGAARRLRIDRKLDFSSRFDGQAIRRQPLGGIIDRAYRSTAPA